MIGRVLDSRYSIVRLLGQGGMGAVYEARHTGTGRRVAIKIILEKGAQSDQQLARFQREARAVGAAESDHIAQVFDTGTDFETGSPYIAMEFLDGEDVESLIDRLGPLPVDLALRLALQAALGLESAHGAGVVHRDIKPANMFLAKKPDGRRVVKLLDFGIAKFLPREGDGHTLTKTGAMVGSPLYMSPEQARGGELLDERTDLWSLGISTFETLCGERPNERVEGLGALLMAICTTPPPSVQTIAPWVPAEVAAVVRKALMIDRKERYASATELVRALAALLPNGHDITESMLTPVSADERSSVAPSIGSGGSAKPSSLQDSNASLSASSPASVGASTGAPVSAASTAPELALSTSASLGGVGVPRSSDARDGRDGLPSSLVLPTRSSSRLVTGVVAAALLAGTIAITWKLARSGDAKISSPTTAAADSSASAAPILGATLTPATSEPNPTMVVTPVASVTSASASPTAPTAAVSTSTVSSVPPASVKRPPGRASAPPAPTASPAAKKAGGDEETSRK